jgi:hypothetical protein
MIKKNFPYDAVEIKKRGAKGLNLYEKKIKWSGYFDICRC